MYRGYKCDLIYYFIDIYLKGVFGEFFLCIIGVKFK